MKDGYILKNKKKSNLSQEDIDLINSFTRRKLTEDEVYVFSVVLCDNDIDRENEKFTDNALEKLSKLYIGKTGIMDHEVKTENQTARIFSCKVEKFSDRFNKLNEPYCRLVAKAYMPRCSKNEDIILSIDSGIKKEVSVGCAVNSIKCSICGKDLKSDDCQHVKGKSYKKAGKQEYCYAILDDPIDAYEWSFVAIPAQRAAGVIKTFKPNFNRSDFSLEDIVKQLSLGKSITFNESQSKKLFDIIETLKIKAEIGNIYQNELKNEVVKLSTIIQPDIGIDIMKNLTDKMSVDELKVVRDSFKNKLSDIIPVAPQLKPVNNEQIESLNGQFKI